MDKTDFTDEERALILAVASGSDSKLERILGQLPCIAPGVAFIAYGVVTQQIHAVTIGALSVLLYQCWGLVQDLRYAPIYSAICRKIARTFAQPGTVADEPPRQ